MAVTVGVGLEPWPVDAAATLDLQAFPAVRDAVAAGLAAVSACSALVTALASAGIVRGGRRLSGGKCPGSEPATLFPLPATVNARLRDGAVCTVPVVATAVLGGPRPAAEVTIVAGSSVASAISAYHRERDQRLRGDRGNHPELALTCGPGFTHGGEVFRLVLAAGSIPPRSWLGAAQRGHSGDTARTQRF